MSQLTGPQQFQLLPPPPVDTVPSPKPRRRWPWVVGVAVAGITGIAIGSASHGTQSTTAAAPQPTPITKTVTAPAQTITQTVTVSKPAETPVAAGPRTEFGAGTYEVGIDIKPGKYKTPGPDKSGWVPSCYWARNKNASGSFDAIIANDNIEGPGTVTVNNGEVLELSGSCVWTLAE